LATANYIIAELEKQGWKAEIQEFTFKNTQVRNILAREGSVGFGKKIVILGAHYDTRPYADRNPPGEREQAILGANDGASGVAVLLELARSLEREKLELEVWLVFFDAEDRGNLEGWPFSVGAEYFAANLFQPKPREISGKIYFTRDPRGFGKNFQPKPREISGKIYFTRDPRGFGKNFQPKPRGSWAKSTLPKIYVASGEKKDIKPEYVIIVDMVGDADQQFYFERNSSRELMEKIWNIASDLGYEEQFIKEYKWAIMDDHIPFLRRGIVAVDIIDFDYPYWHTTQDTPDKLSPESLERVGRVLEELLEHYFNGS
jgi:Zn-dependent M28 family amino/carboxypeptidase